MSIAKKDSFLIGASVSTNTSPFIREYWDSPVEDLFGRQVKLANKNIGALNRAK